MRNAADKEQKGDFAQPYCLLSITTAARVSSAARVVEFSLLPSPAPSRSPHRLLRRHLRLLRPRASPSHENSVRVTLDHPAPRPRPLPDGSVPFRVRCGGNESERRSETPARQFRRLDTSVQPSEQPELLRLRFHAIYLNSDEFRASIDGEVACRRPSTVPNKTYRRALDEESLVSKGNTSRFLSFSNDRKRFHRRAFIDLPRSFRHDDWRNMHNRTERFVVASVAKFAETRGGRGGGGERGEIAPPFRVRFAKNESQPSIVDRRRSANRRAATRTQRKRTTGRDGRRARVYTAYASRAGSFVSADRLANCRNKGAAGSRRGCL